MPTEQFTIRRRPLWSFMGDITASIECDPLAPQPIKLGLAVRAALKSGAVLRGADLSGAVLSGADLSGADLSGADLSGAVLRGDKIARIFARVQREIDPYTFVGVELEAGGYKIAAGCRWFTDAEFRTHVASEYPDTDKAAETLAILDFIAARAKALGIGETAEAA